MLTKFIPTTLLVLAALVTTVHGTGPLPATSIGAAHSQTTPARLRAPMATAVAIHTPGPIAIDDYRMNLEGGVTVNAYNLVPLAEHDTARNQSMIDGIAGRRSTRNATAADDGNDAWATNLLPRTETAVLWLAGLMAVLLMALRRRE